MTIDPQTKENNTPDGFFKLINPNGPVALWNIKIIRQSDTGDLLVKDERRNDGTAYGFTDRRAK